MSLTQIQPAKQNILAYFVEGAAIVIQSLESSEAKCFSYTNLTSRRIVYKVCFLKEELKGVQVMKKYGWGYQLEWDEKERR